MKFAKFLRKLFVQNTGNFIKKEPLTQVFSCEFCEISKNTFFTEHLWTTASAGISVYWQNPFSEETALELLIKSQQKSNQRKENQKKIKKMRTEQQERTLF